MERKTWDEFRDSGLLWFVNSILHMFGWAITVDANIHEDKSVEILEVFPSRVKYTGFSEESNESGYNKVWKYLRKNIDNLGDGTTDFPKSDD